MEAYHQEERKETERFRPYTYDDLVARDKVNLDITWMKDPALDDADSLLPPEVIAQDLQAALSEFAAIAESLGGEVPPDVIEDAPVDSPDHTRTAPRRPEGAELRSCD